MRRIYLIGFMGSGKTSVGKLISEKLKIKFLDLDVELLKLTKYESINDIFKNENESFFRDLETQALKNSLSIKQAIISTGGGIITKVDNQKMLKTEGNIIIYLKTKFEEIEKRLVGEQQRPLFQNKDKALELYNNRLPIYLELADFIINTDNKSLEEIYQEIEVIL